MLDEAPPTFFRLSLEVGFGILAYDFVFYWIHLFMHIFPRLPHGHSVHHELVEAVRHGVRQVESPPMQPSLDRP